MFIFLKARRTKKFMSGLPRKIRTYDFTSIFSVLTFGLGKTDHLPCCILNSIFANTTRYIVSDFISLDLEEKFVTQLSLQFQPEADPPLAGVARLHGVQEVVGFRHRRIRLWPDKSHADPTKNTLIRECIFLYAKRPSSFKGGLRRLQPSPVQTISSRSTSASGSGRKA